MNDEDEVVVRCVSCEGGASRGRDGCGWCANTGLHAATLAAGERERIYREELEKRIAGMEDVTAQALLSRMNTAGYEAWAVGAPRATYDLIRDALRAALLPPEGE